MDRLGSPLRRLIKRLRRQGSSAHDAEDLIQEAFLRMQVYCSEGGEVREPEAFLARTARRLSINALRDRHGDLYVDEPVEALSLVDLSSAPEEMMAADDCLRSMTAALEAVSPRTCEVFFLHRVDGLSYAQIARRMAISVSAIEKHIARAVAALSEPEVTDRVMGK